MTSLCSVMKRIRSSASSTIESLRSASSFIVSTSGILLSVHLERDPTASSILNISVLRSSPRSSQNRFIWAEAPFVRILLVSEIATVTSVAASTKTAMMISSISLVLMDEKNALLFFIFIGPRYIPNSTQSFLRLNLLYHRAKDLSKQFAQNIIFNLGFLSIIEQKIRLQCNIFACFSVMMVSERKRRLSYA